MEICLEKHLGEVNECNDAIFAETAIYTDCMATTEFNFNQCKEYANCKVRRDERLGKC